MSILEAHNRLRRAAAFVAEHDHQEDRRALLLSAWETLRGLRPDDFPADHRAHFSFLQHELVRVEREEITAREANFLLTKLCGLERNWIERPDIEVRIAGGELAAVLEM